MTIRDLVRAYLLADSTVTALISTRIFANVLPQKVTYPAVSIQVIDIVRPATLRAVGSLATARIQLDAYVAPTSGVSSRSMADEIGAALRRRLDGFSGSFSDDSVSPAADVNAWITFETENESVVEEIAGGLSRHSADYFVQYQTSGGTY